MDGERTRTQAKRTDAKRTMSVTSKAWRQGERIPARHALDGENVSPPVDFANVPDEAQTLVVMMEDADAPEAPFTHWLVWNVPAEAGGLEAGQDVQALGAVQGRNDFGAPGYRGPSPPEGEEHRYYLRVFAVRGALPLQTAVPREEVERAMEGLVAATGEYLGTYRRG